MFLALALCADALRLWTQPVPVPVPVPPPLGKGLTRDVRSACTAAERRESRLTPALAAQILREEGPWTRLR